MTKSHMRRSCGGASSATCSLNPRTARAGWPLPPASSKLGHHRPCPCPRPRPRTRRHGHHRAPRCPVLNEARNIKPYTFLALVSVRQRQGPLRFALCASPLRALHFSYRQVYVQGYKLSCHGVHIWVGSSLYSFRMHSSVVFIWDLERGGSRMIQVPGSGS